MNVLITGVNGFVGTHLSQNLRKQQIKIYGLGTEPDTSQPLNGYFSIDISQPFDLEMEFDAVIHLAALNRTNIDADIRESLFHQINVTGTKNLIQSCHFKKFIYLSSAGIYSRESEIITESSPIKPVGNYFRTKYEAELLCRDRIPEHQLLILRPVNITGFGQKTTAAVPFFFERAIKNQPIDITVSPAKTMQLLAVSDFVHCIRLLLDSDSRGIFNISNKDSMPIKELVAQIIKLCNSKSSVTLSNKKEEARSIVSSEKVRSVIKWNASKNILDILNDYYTGGTGT